MLSVAPRAGAWIEWIEWIETTIADTQCCAIQGREIPATCHLASCRCLSMLAQNKCDESPSRVPLVTCHEIRFSIPRLLDHRCDKAPTLVPRARWSAFGTALHRAASL